MTWSNPDLWFSGLGSALVGGVVAALTALVVVRLTDRYARQQERRTAARSEVIALLRASSQFLRDTSAPAQDVGESQNNLRILSAVWMIELGGAVSAVAAVDAPFLHTLDRLFHQVRSTRDALLALDTTGDDAAQAWEVEQRYTALYRTMASELADLTGELTQWLSKVR
jgi:hypothetical protein